MKKIISLVLMGCLLSLSGCSLFRIHKMDIEQGNVFTQEDVSRLHKGMSESQVKSIMGTPTLVNIFTPNRMDYIYVWRPGYGQVTEKRVICLFQNGRLTDIQRR